MKKTLLSIIAAVASGMAYAAPAPYPLTINSRSRTVDPVTVYRGSECSFRVRFTDGATASDISGCIPFMSWSTNANATGVSTSSYTIVSATNGMVDFHFDPSAVNFAAGRYLYEVGVRSNAVPRVYRQGIFQIYNSPVGAGVSAVTWSTPVNWSLLDWSNLPTITVNGVTGSIETNLSFTVTGSGGGSVTSVNGQTGTVTITASGMGALTNETDTLALEALSTNKVTKVFDTTGTRWIDGTGGVWQVTQVASTEYVDLVFSDDFATTNGHSPVSKRIVLPYSSGTGQTIACDSDGVYWAIHATIGWYGLGIVELEHFYNTPNYIKMTAQTRDGGFQPVRPALFSYTSGDGGPPSGTAQIEIHYNTVTSALPRVAFVSDTASLLSTNGNGSALTDMTVSQIAGAYPASNPSNFVTQTQLATYTPLASPALTGNPTVNGVSISNLWLQLYCSGNQAAAATVTPGGRVISNSATNGAIMVNAAAMANQWTTYQIVCGANTIYTTNYVNWAAFGAGNDSGVVAAWTQSALTASTYTNKTFVVPPYTTSSIAGGNTYVMLKINGIKTNTVSNFDVFQILARPATAAEVSAYQVAQ